MSAAKAVTTRLTDDTAVVAAVADRVYAVDADTDETYPRLVYEVTDDKPPRHYKGESGLLKADVTIACQSRTYEGALALATLVRTALEAKGVWGGVTVQGCFYNSGIENREQVESGVDVFVYTRELNFTLWVEE